MDPAGQRRRRGPHARNRQAGAAARRRRRRGRPGRHDAARCRHGRRIRDRRPFSHRARRRAGNRTALGARETPRRHPGVRGECSRAVIETSSALAEFVARIGETDRVGVDTEADSLHCYREKICLVQVGLPGADELVDPLAGLDLSPLLDSLSHTEMVMHGADFDLRMLYRLGLGAPSRVFDTMIAARLTGAARFGYSALVAEHFGVTLPKGLQTANWARRPLPANLARYARNDTHYLLRLAESL
ncbi:MAG: ribonuclease D, partial [Acidobacteria bacterium]|nr:ribonuclease D [Acidobacteriota bacterium]